MNRISIYWSIPFHVSLSDKIATITAVNCEKISPQFFAIQYLQEEDYWVKNCAEKRELRASEIRVQAWENGKIIPCWLESYACIDNSRLRPDFKKQKEFLRFEFSEEILNLIRLAPTNRVLSEKTTSHTVQGRILAENFFNDCSPKALLTLTDENTALVTMEMTLHKANLDTICSYMRKEFLQRVHSLFYELLVMLPMIKNLEIVTGVRPYLFIVVHEQSNLMSNAREVVAANIQYYYSLWSGVERDEPTEQVETEFLAQNESTRRDVFLAVGEHYGLLVEATGRQEKFTRKRIVLNAPKQLIRCRETYNYTNYIVWLELLLSLKQALKTPGADQKSMQKFYERIQGNRVAKYADPYARWLEKWAQHLGNDRIFRDLPPVKTVSGLEQIQNLLSGESPMNHLLHGSINYLGSAKKQLQTCTIPEAIDFIGRTISLKNDFLEIQACNSGDNARINTWRAKTYQKFRLDHFNAGEMPYLVEFCNSLEEKITTDFPDCDVDVQIYNLPRHMVFPVKIMEVCLQELCREFLEYIKLLNIFSKININTADNDNFWEIVLDTIGIGLNCHPHELFTSPGNTGKVLQLGKPWFAYIVVATCYQDNWCQADNHERSFDLSEGLENMRSPGTRFRFGLRHQGKLIDWRQT